jgi:putative transposase
MKKINLRQLRWIIRQRRAGELSVYQIARQQGITPRYVRMLHRRYQGVPDYYICKIRLKKCGRKPKALTRHEIDGIMSAKREYPDMGAVSIEKILRSKGISISHNRIHQYFKANALANTEPKKGRRRKYVRYERHYSNSLWHTDWHETKLGNLIAFLDDHSRFIVSYGIYRNATTNNSLKAYYEAIDKYGIPKQLMSDHGTQFCKDPEYNYKFRNEIEKRGTQHILARVKHPQSNGKMERFFYTFERLMKYFDDVDKAVEYYNFKRPHMSLERDGKSITPYEAFVLKNKAFRERLLNENTQTILSRGS